MWVDELAALAAVAAPGAVVVAAGAARVGVVAGATDGVLGAAMAVIGRPLRSGALRSRAVFFGLSGAAAGSAEADSLGAA